MISLKQGLLTLLVCTAFISSSVLAKAGNVIYGFGDNYALDRDGNKRKIGKGDDIFSGDTLITSKRGRMHVRFDDGGMVSVYPRSEYKIDEFNYIDGGTKDEKGFFSLLRGAARQVTGLLGKQRRENFRFKTAVATIGIRGTGFFAQLCQGDCFDEDGNQLPDGMYVKNDTGIITMTTDGGDVELAQGQSAFAASKQESPQQINEPTASYNIAVNDVETYDFDIGDTQDGGGSNGAPDVPPTPTAPIVLNVLDSVFFESASGPIARKPSVDTSVTGETINLTNNAITAFSGSEFSNTVAFDSTGGVLEENGRDTNLRIIWNRWSGNFATSDNGNPIFLDSNNIHMIGAEALTSTLPTNITIDYSGTAGTSPTFSGGAGSDIGTQSVGFTIDYSAGLVTALNVDTTFTNGTLNATFQNTPPEILTGNSTLIAISAPCSASLCGFTSTMNGNVSINLVGANAEGAFGAYSMTDFSSSTVTGTYVANGTLQQAQQ